MQRIVITAHFRGQAAEPSGDPPSTDPRASSVSIEVATADESSARIERASYDNHAVFTGEATFRETGTIVYGEGDAELDIAIPHGALKLASSPSAAVSKRVTSP